MKTNFGRIGLCALLASVLILSACAPAATSSISVESAWGKPSMDYPTAGGMYMMVNNSGTASDRLLSGSSPACGSIEVHDMVKKADGTMGMNLVDKPVEVAANGQVEFKSGALHIMCISKNEQFKVGSKIDLTLKFEKAGEKTFAVDIRAQ
jgi:periplasmic copper chaperone A